MSLRGGGLYRAALFTALFSALTAAAVSAPTWAQTANAVAGSKRPVSFP